MNQVSKEPVVYQWKNGRWQIASSGIIVEKPVSLTVNGQVWLTFMCTPVDLEALAVGFLYNEGHIESKDALASVRVCPTGENVDVWLSHSIEKPKEWRRTSGCTGGQTSSDASGTTPIAGQDFQLPPEDIQRQLTQLFDSQELYKQVGGVHTSALSDGSRILLVADDIGRHNTLDKLAGRALLEGIAPTRRMLLTTGRISSEMIQKAARMGAAVVISRTSPSSLSVELAERWGITLIGYARRERFNVYAHSERIMPPGYKPEAQAALILNIPPEEGVNGSVHNL